MVIRSQKELENIAKDILNLHPGILALEGPLGAGKTTLTKYITKQLGVKDEVTSPTFVLHTSYILNHKSYGALHHIDCWRMEDFSELENIGLYEMLDHTTPLSPSYVGGGGRQDGGGMKGNLVIIEWADRFKSQIQNLKSQKILWVKLDYANNEDERSISYEDFSH